MRKTVEKYIYDPFEHPRLFHIGRKVLRLRLGKKYKHLSSCTPFLKLSDTSNETEGKEIYWKGKVIGKTAPLVSLKNTISGKVFIVATGPSLAKIDFGLLKDQNTFGVNGAIAKYQGYDFKPQYYTVTDRDFFENRFEMIEAIIESGAKCLFSLVGISRICMMAPHLLKKGNIYLTEVINQWYDKPKFEDEELKDSLRNNPKFLVNKFDVDHSVGFSRDPAEGIFCGKTIPYRAIQHANYMGAKKVLLLGVDLGYKGDLSRFYEDNRNTRPSKIERDFSPYIEPSFKTLKRFIDSNENNGFEVFNLSNTSRLSEKVIPRMSFEEALRL